MLKWANKLGHDPYKYYRQKQKVLGLSSFEPVIITQKRDSTKTL